ncbi:MAG: hypothetical protein KDI49_10460 [Gammaproteobacteria bacterium]|nr:hypothetical protein [Gammaproteobacteria bacterium]
MQRFNQCQRSDAVKSSNLGEFRAEINNMQLFGDKRTSKPHASAGLLVIRHSLALAALELA